MTLRRRIKRLESSGNGGDPHSGKGLAALLSEPLQPLDIGKPSVRREIWAHWRRNEGFISLYSEEEMLGWIGPDPNP